MFSENKGLGSLYVSSLLFCFFIHFGYNLEVHLVFCFSRKSIETAGENCVLFFALHKFSINSCVFQCQTDPCGTCTLPMHYCNLTKKKNQVLLLCLVIGKMKIMVLYIAHDSVCEFLQDGEIDQKVGSRGYCLW